MNRQGLTMSLRPSSFAFHAHVGSRNVSEINGGEVQFFFPTHLVDHYVPLAFTKTLGCHHAGAHRQINVSCLPTFVRAPKLLIRSLLIQPADP